MGIVLGKTEPTKIGMGTKGDIDVCQSALNRGWVPDDVNLYLAHVVGGESIRSLARARGAHASTILRQIRRCEQRRDDPLVERALSRLDSGALVTGKTIENKERNEMKMSDSAEFAVPDDTTLGAESRRVLRRLAEPGACLAVAEGMEKAVVVREAPDGQTLRTGVVDAPVAEALALAGWIAPRGNGRIARYVITTSGRSRLNELLAEEENSRVVADLDDDDTAGSRRGMRYGRTDTPLMQLARRRDKDGTPFLSSALIRAGERLREDYELAKMGPVTEDAWEKILLGGYDTAAIVAADPMATGPEGAAHRMAMALRDLGPGLGDVVLRVCCYLEGLESVEQRFGWAARSGKIVLRIGLQRLLRHYEDQQGRFSPMIG